jgi:GNAT superfamily N-acetyltransferase
MNLTIRRMRTEDIASGLRLCRLSRWNQLEEDWRAFLDSPDGGGRIAERDGLGIGTAAFLRYGNCFSWLSMMLVDPQARGAGIGTRLMEAVLEALANEACVRLDATPLGEPLYRRFGFRDEYTLLRTAIALPLRAGLEPASDKGRPMEERDFPEVLARDRLVFGADRAALLESLYRRAPELARVVYADTELKGYCFGRPGHLYRQLGPVVADDEAAARMLVAGCLSGQPGGKVAMDVPQSKPQWTAWLESAGFVVERPFLRMCRGEAPHPELAARQFAIAGPEFG